MRFKILDKGNFYFSVLDRGKKFEVEDTIDINLNKKYTKLIETCLKFKDSLYFGMLAEPIWDAVKAFQRKYKNYWFVPIVLYKLGKDYICSVDMLRKVK